MSQNLSRRRACAPGRRRFLQASLQPLAGLALGVPALSLRAQVDPLKVGFVYVTPVGQAGWTYQHELGRLALQRELGDQVLTRAVESVPEGADAERVMRDLVAQGHRLIFATSFGYLEPALRVAADHPQVRFEHAGGYKTAPNLNTYNARFYEGRWLAGWLAGKLSRSGIAGYVAGFPVPEVVQGINAFARGMREARPDARVRVLWLETWFDPPREREAALTLVNGGADMLAHHSASTAVPQIAQELAARGVRLFAYPSDMRRFAPDAQAAAVTADWSGYYVSVARSVIAGTWQPTPKWGGLASGMVRLEGVPDSLPAALRSELAKRREALIARRAGPFVASPSAPLIDRQGHKRLASGRLPDEDIAGMDWFVMGVSGTLPKR